MDSLANVSKPLRPLSWQILLIPKLGNFTAADQGHGRHGMLYIFPT